jgi:cytochrome d ubiquinol oxidase subunit I
MNVALLSRIQFALTASFHFLFPPMTIGLGVVLVIMQALRLRTGNPLYYHMARFWTRVFGLIFAVGVASGIVLEFQFGTNWATYARFVGDIFGSPLAIEGIYAFFLESGFLALLLFGWDRVGPRMHFFSTCTVALGAHFSAIWILVANSWMQSPAGFHLARQVKVMTDGRQFPLSADLGAAAFTLQEVALPAGYIVQPGDLQSVRAVVDSFSEAILNPSTLDRLSHTILACWITGAFLVVAVSAWYLLRGRHVAAARGSLRIGLAFGAVASVLQLVAADSTARGVAENQPTKLAALEGLATTQSRAPLGIAGWVSWERDAGGGIVGVDTHALRVPGLLSVLVSGDFLDPVAGSKAVVRGLADLPSDEFLRARHPHASDAELRTIRPRYWPNVPVVFQTYHLMIALGMALIGISLLGCLLWASGRLWDAQSKSIRTYLWLLVATILMAQVATQAGWFTAEMGRQPWVVYGVLQTSRATSTAVKAPQVLLSIILFTLVYLMLLVLFLYLLARRIGEGPAETEAVESLPEHWQTLPLKTRRHTRA